LNLVFGFSLQAHSIKTITITRHIQIKQKDKQIKLTQSNNHTVKLKIN